MSSSNLRPMAERIATLSASDLCDPLDKQPIGDMSWLIALTGWSHDKASRLARLRLIPGAFKALPGVRGSTWNFRKAKTIAWLEGLETK